MTTSHDDSFTTESKRLLDPIDRISEILFGLLMAVTIVGSLSIATAGQDEVRTVLIAALGCNLAWGLVDAVMYLVRTLTEKTRHHALTLRIRGAEPAAAHRMIALALPAGLAPLVGPAELEAMTLAPGRAAGGRPAAADGAGLAVRAGRVPARRRRHVSGGAAVRVRARPADGDEVLALRHAGDALRCRVRSSAAMPGTAGRCSRAS